MKKILTLLTFASTFSFGQYYSEATIKLKKIDEPLKVYDLRYNSDKLIQFRIAEMPNALATAKVKHIEDLKFDPASYSETIPKLKQTYIQNEFNLPEGVYETIDQYIAKTPIDIKVNSKSHYKAAYYEYANDLVQFFDTSKSEFPMKNVFAVVHNGELYLNVKAIMKNRGEGNGNLSKDIPNTAFLRVKAGTEKYPYVEMPMTKTSSALLAGVAGGLTAGVASIGASAVMAGVYSGIANGIVGIASPSLMKGIVLDTETREYDIFKNCKDFNSFLEKKNLSKQVDCEKDYHLSGIRGTMNEL